MKNILLGLIFLIGFNNVIFSANAELPNEADLLICQDQASNFGNGKGDDTLSENCQIVFKKNASIFSVKQSSITKTKFFGYRNIVLIERLKDKKIITDIIAGSGTEMKAIQALAFDEKNKEIAVLEDSGDILFFSSVVTGNVAPLRKLEHKELLGATDLLANGTNNQIIVVNKNTNRLLIFSRLANINARTGNQKLAILKIVDTTNMNLKDLAVDDQKSELSAFDSIKQQNIIFNLK